MAVSTVHIFVHIRSWHPGRGQQESPSKTKLPEYDPSVCDRIMYRELSWQVIKCYLCPGNKRAQGDVNPKYESTFAFVNDYSAVKEEQAELKAEGDPRGLFNFPCPAGIYWMAKKRSFEPPTPRGPSHRQMLRDNLLALSQPHPCRSYSKRNPPRHSDLDTNLLGPHLAQISSSLSVPNHSPATTK